MQIYVTSQVIYWTLISNARQYKRVLEICENQAKTQKGVIGEKLGKVIEEVKK
jgi:hypothetical protein